MSSVLLFLAVLFGVIAGAVLQPLVEAEILGSWPLLTRALLRLAARQLPADARGDVLAEWAAELDNPPRSAPLRACLRARPCRHHLAHIR